MIITLWFLLLFFLFFYFIFFFLIRLLLLVVLLLILLLQCFTLEFSLAVSVSNRVDTINKVYNYFNLRGNLRVESNAV